MSGERTVLVLTHWFDPTVDYVIEELNRREVPVVRCNPGDFPGQLTLAATLRGGWAGGLRTADRRVDFADIGCVYYRRPTAFEFPDAMSEPERKWAAREARMGLGGVLAALPRWLNHPADIAYSEYKPAQLAAAGAAGLRVPETLITNEVAEARAFVEAVESAVYKPLAGGGVAEEGTYRLIYATPVAAEEIDDSVTRTAHLFQAWVPKDHEVRVTVVDEQLHAVRIDARSDAATIDWRRDYDHLGYTVTEVPAAVRRAVLALMRGLRLRFGALDFVVTPGGKWVFLEVNPNGQWAWIQDQTGLPIAASIADALTKE